MEWFLVVVGATLIGAFIETEGRKRKKEADEINRKLDLLLERFTTT